MAGKMVCGRRARYFGMFVIFGEDERRPQAAFAHADIRSGAARAHMGYSVTCRRAGPVPWYFVCAGWKRTTAGFAILRIAQLCIVKKGI
jgi:hypothetical protein